MPRKNKRLPIKSRTKNADPSHLNLAIESAGIGLWVWDVQKDQITWDKGMHNIFGIKPGKFGATYADFERLVFPEDRDFILNAIMQTLQTGKDHASEYRIQPADGSPVRVISAKGRLYRNRYGKPIKMAGVCMDITSIRNSEENQAMLSAIVTSSDDAIFRMSQSGIIQSWNKAAEKLYGYTSSEIIGQPISTLFPVEKKNELKKIQEKLGEGLIIRTEIDIKSKSGHLIPISANISPICSPRGKVIGISAVTRDLIKQRYADNMKNDFISTVSHELRTPLTSIQGSLAILTNATYTKLPNNALKLITIAKQNCNRLINIINDMLDLQKIESGKLEFNLNLFDLNKAIRDAVSALDAYAVNFSVHIVTQLSPTPIIVYSDYERLQQVITNLLSNAIKFSPIEGEVNIILKQIGDKARIEISDQGTGIPEEFKSHVFQKFMQAEPATTRRKGGSGLGLSIVKTILDRLGGSINFKTSNAGTTFNFEIPLAKNEREATNDIRSFKKHYQILICEFDEVRIQTIKKIFSRYDDFKIYFAKSCAEAKDILSNTQVDMLVVDIIQNRNDGLSLVKELQQYQSLHSCPVIMVSIEKAIEKKLTDYHAFNIIKWIEIPRATQDLIATVQALKIAKDQQTPRILHVEDDRDLTIVTANLLQDYSHLTCVNTINGAKEVLSNQNYDLVILDLVLPDGSGLELLPILSKQSIPVIVFTGYELPDSYTSFIKKCVVKSKTSYNELLQSIHHELNKRQVREKICQTEN